jgi:hypothetical protein
MERYGTVCVGRDLAAWALYGYAALTLWQWVRQAGLPEGLSWIGAAFMAAAVLVWTREV